MKYSDFVKSKLGTQSCSGIARFAREYPLFPHQQDLAAWALRRGRAAIFADTGLGKSRMQLAWADTVCHETKGDVLILAPLAVAEQTVAEGEDIGVSVKHVRDQSPVMDSPSSAARHLRALRMTPDIIEYLAAAIARHTARRNNGRARQAIRLPEWRAQYGPLRGSVQRTDGARPGRSGWVATAATPQGCSAVVRVWLPQRQRRGLHRVCGSEG